MGVATYPKDVESAMRMLYHSLSERDRRRYAAVEAAKLGHGGITYLAGLFSCSTRTIGRGLDELRRPPALPVGRSRKKGADANGL